jgi:hypothetical protein
MDVDLSSLLLASHGKISISIPGQIGVLVEKFPLYTGTSNSGEIDILQGFPKYFPSTLSMLHIYLFIYSRTI